jgi:drug/metabolite transporter (DMT)-like permease
MNSRWSASPTLAFFSALTIGPALMVVAGNAIFPVMDGIAKGLAGMATVSTIAFFRYLTQVVLSAPSAYRQTGGRFLPRRPWLLALRGLLFCVSGLLFFAGVQRLPLADNLAITFVYPLFVWCIAPFLLHERIAPRAVAALAVGFTGTLIIIRPGTGAFGPAVIFPLLFAVCYAGYTISTRALAQGDDAPSVLQFWTAIYSALFTLVVFAIGALADVPSLALHFTPGHVLVSAGAILAMGIVGTIGHWLVTSGARHLSAPMQSGLSYTEIVSATLLGWVVWGDLPDAATWLGLSLVVTSGIWLLRINGKR